MTSGGGDTRFGFLLDLTGAWCIGVPMAFFSVFFLDLPVYWVMALVVTEEIYKLGLGIPRFRSRKWIRNLVKNNWIRPSNVYKVCFWEDRWPQLNPPVSGTGYW